MYIYIYTYNSIRTEIYIYNELYLVHKGEDDEMKI